MYGSVPLIQVHFSVLGLLSIRVILRVRIIEH